MRRLRVAAAAYLMVGVHVTTAGCVTSNGPTLDLLPDTDGDGILDLHEGMDDADGDGLPNAWDEDSDGDLLPDSVEAGDLDPTTPPVDSDGDGTPDFLDIDSDNQCPEDRLEGFGRAMEDADLDGLADWRDGDDDNDTVPDVYERSASCGALDTDGDGVDDDDDPDADGDGVGDRWEYGATAWDPTPADTDGDGTPDLRDLDSDDDGLLDRDESGVASPEAPPIDTDGDGYADLADADADGDGLPDADEVAGVTSHLLRDTDGDGQTDLAELTFGADPTNPASVLPGLYAEVAERTDVEVALTAPPHVAQLDVAWVVDVSSSMGDVVAALIEAVPRFDAAVREAFADPAYALAVYSDYAIPTDPVDHDTPFLLEVATTRDPAAISIALTEIVPQDGKYTPEATWEATRQALTGAGYDMLCNGVYNVSQDVPAYQPDAADLFGGAGPVGLEGLGTGGGVGFRAGAVPAVVVFTDGPIKDPGSPDAYVGDTPDGCPFDADDDRVAEALVDAGAAFFGVDVSQGEEALPSFVAMLDAAGRAVDFDADPATEPPAIAVDRTTLVDPATWIEPAVAALSAQARELRPIGHLELHPNDDPRGLIVDVWPPAVDVGPDDPPAMFTVTLRGVVSAAQEDQVLGATLVLEGDDGAPLAEIPVTAIIPGG